MRTRTRIGTLLVGLSIFMYACQVDEKDPIVPSSNISIEQRAVSDVYLGLEVSSAFTAYI